MGGGLAFAGSLGRRGLRRGSKFLCVHAPDYFVNVRRGQVRVPLRHFGSLVAQHFAYGQEACAIHGKVARCRMPQVVEPEFLNAGSLQCETPWLANQSSTPSRHFRPVARSGIYTNQRLRLSKTGFFSNPCSANIS